MRTNSRVRRSFIQSIVRHIVKLIDWLYDMTNAEAVADIGAGTGIFTSALLKKPWSVTAVEPNSDMLSILKKALGGKVSQNYITECYLGSF